MEAFLTRFVLKTEFRNWTLLGLGIFITVLASAISGCRLGGDHVKSTRPHGCAECHIDIVCQWENSPHADAWISETFQGRVEGYPKCLPCHAPEPLLEQAPSSELLLRNDYQADGVDCHACHAYCGGYAGPHKTFGPHGMEQDLTRLPCSEFCGRCHAVEYSEYETLYLEHVGAECAQECNGCHMPTYVDRLTQGHLLSYIHPKRLVHDHSFPLWTATITDGNVEVAKLAANPLPDSRLAVEIILVNRGAGHRIPTGEYGHKEVVLAVEIEDGTGSVVGKAEESIYAGDDEALAPGMPTTFKFEVSLDEHAKPLSVDMTFERVDKERTFRYSLAEQSIVVGE